MRLHIQLFVVSTFVSLILLGAIWFGLRWMPDEQFMMQIAAQPMLRLAVILVAGIFASALVAFGLAPLLQRRSERRGDPADTRLLMRAPRFHR